MQKSCAKVAESSAIGTITVTPSVTEAAKTELPEIYDIRIERPWWPNQKPA
jgi:hypothetical protein